MDNINPDVSAPFDAEAEIYDEVFSHTTLGRWLRQQVWERLAAHFKAGDHILELGCGTGEDTSWLVNQGIRVTATEQSHAMLRRTQQKIDQEHLSNLAQLRLLDLNKPEVLFESKFDGVLANFGVLNCVEHRERFARLLSKWIKSEGVCVLVMMNPYCPWEMLWHLLHGKFGKSFRRIGKDGVSAPLSGGTKIEVWYPTPEQMISEFAPFFVPVRLQGVGVFLPPTYLNHLVESFTGLFERMYWLEKKLAKASPWKRLNDHFILELQRC
jgi:ubiquinone/menaquinone biosynthesis C-methylase UbiE